MNRTTKASRILARCAALCVALSLCNTPTAAQADYQQFNHPPQAYEPWTYWMWVNGNVSKSGVQKDLEAMHKVGINGAILLDVDQDSPDGPVNYGDSLWLGVFEQTVRTADSLGMEIGANNGAGYWGSGGPWVKPEMAMQWVVSSETYVNGPGKWNGQLKSPASGDDYRDIAVIAIPVIDTTEEKRYNLYDFPLKSCQNPGNAGPVRYSCAPMTYRALQWPGFPRYLMYRGTQSAPLAETAPDNTIIPYDKIIDLTPLLSADGQLEWDVPAGEWTIIRFGHQWTGSCIGPVTDKVIGPETDKLNKEATRYHVRHIVQQLKAAGRENAFDMIHIDSWEGGGQNWTPGFEEIFREKRGYDIRPWMPVLTGRIINSLQETERFLYDLRHTISEMFIENYVQEFQKLLHAEGLKFSYECYTTPASDVNAMQYIDIPTAEFWIPVGWHPNFDPTVKLMASAAHLNGTQVVAAEALTSSGAERWQWHPARMKPLVDAAFCGGVNRLVFHRYSSQCFDVPGPAVQMNMWGTKYERTNTWWNFSTAWHRYVTRCQYLLQQGDFRADVLVLQPEEPMQRFAGLALNGYDYDVIGEEAFRKVTADAAGWHYPGRAPYKLLVLTDTELMSVEQLRHISRFVAQGGCLLGNRPKSVPGLHNYKEREAQLRSLADTLWGKAPADSAAVRPFGKGRVYTGMSIEAALADMGLPCDFRADHELKYIHKALGDDDCYFVANTADTAFTAQCHFRTAGKEAEIWDAETGQRYRTPVSPDGQTSALTLPFGANKSYFVVFRPKADATLPQLPLGEKHVNATEVGGSWALSFPQDMVARGDTVLPALIPWNELPDEDMKYFSGTARYTKNLTLTAEQLSAGTPLMLDLGRVEVMARVRLNGKDLGTAWRAPYRFDLTKAAVVGKNRLEIEVVNLWPNRLIGDEQLPDDVGYVRDGTLDQWPDWLLNGRKRTSGRKVFSARKQWNADEPLLPSGLLGPVVLYNNEPLYR